MNVLFVVPSLKIRGAERMMVNLINQLDPQRFTVSVVSLSKNNPLAAQLQPGAAQFFTIPRLNRFDIQPAFQIRKTIIEHQTASVVALDIFSFLYVWIALLNIRRKPKVFISIHNTRYNRIKDLFKNIAIARLLSGKELFLSVCNSQADYWAKTYLIPRKRFFTIYNGVDTSYFCPENDLSQRIKARLMLKIPESAFVILQIASLTPEKRHADSLTAFQKMLSDHPSEKIYLVFVGDGPYREQLQAQAAQLGISDRVLFCGVQNDVKLFYAAADLFTLTSSTETFSVAALEAMAMGLPCVLSDVGGAREMMVEGMNGYLVEPRNPRSIAAGWQAALENMNHFKHEKIRNWVVEHFSLSGCVKNHERLFEQA